MHKLMQRRHRAMPLLLIVSMLLTLCLCLLQFPAAFAASTPGQLKMVGPKTYYLALGDSLAFSFQPDLDFSHGYADDFFSNLQGHGVQKLANMGCPGETSSTMIKGGCPYAFLRKYPYISAQLAAAVRYLQKNAGKVSPVTLDIGANDLLPDINTSTCAIRSNFSADLATLDANLKGTILPQLKAALTVNNVVTGDLVMMNYYDPYQNICPNMVPYAQQINKHLASDISGFGIIVNVFSAFTDIHLTTKGYSVIASTFENGTGY